MNDGDFIELSFEMRAGQDKKLISTSKEDLAKKEDIFDDKKKYKDAVIVIGTEGLFKEINDSFKQAEIGKEYEVTVPAKDAYGMRDNKNIKVVPMREFQRNKINPEIGKEVNINNKSGKIISVTPGRVLIDYNHELAGVNHISSQVAHGILFTGSKKTATDAINLAEHTKPCPNHV